jgi:hypothetical protein
VLTVGDLIGSWAPASAGNDSNDTAACISSVSAQTGYSASDPLLSLVGGSEDGTEDSMLVYSSTDDDPSSSGSSTWLVAAAIAAAVIVFNR